MQKETCFYILLKQNKKNTVTTFQIQKLKSNRDTTHKVTIFTTKPTQQDKQLWLKKFEPRTAMQHYNHTTK